VQHQMYVTGSVGASSHGERFTTDYDLPEETSYCETCAAIGLVFWAQRLLNMHAESRFADVMELALYNGVISGVALSGDRYFYVNPLASRGDHHRQEWFGCACCPPNMARLLASLGAYAYSEGEEAWVHLYAAGSAQLQVMGGPVELQVATQYPWSGQVTIAVDPGRTRDFTLNLRVPGWCRQARLRVAGEDVTLERVVRHGYVSLRRTWAPGDQVELALAMPIERVWAHPAVRMVNGKVALQRGPVVYCLEEADNPTVPLMRLAVPGEAVLRQVHEPDLLGGIVTLEGEALLADDADWQGTLYRARAPRMRPVALRAIPYSVWDNRTPGQMLVWLRGA
jgi:uncharacterized protein